MQSTMTITTQVKDSLTPSTLLRGASNPSLTLQEQVKNRNISSLVHFTRVENLPNILKHGLLSRSLAQGQNIHQLTTDLYRYDGKLNGTSLSISHPNEKMFYRKRMDFGPESAWVVIGLDADILWEKECAFYKHNAAESSMRNTCVSRLKGIEAFESMFYGDALRHHQGLNDDSPTDVQAEVLVFDVIEPKYIQGIAFNNRALLQQCQPFLNQAGINGLVLRNLFKKREWL